MPTRHILGWRWTVEFDCSLTSDEMDITMDLEDANAEVGEVTWGPEPQGEVEEITWRRSDYGTTPLMLPGSRGQS